MSAFKEKGKISLKQCYGIEWTIHNFFSSTNIKDQISRAKSVSPAGQVGSRQKTEKDQIYRSPTFSVPGSKWYLEIYPNGNAKYNAFGWISLYLREKNQLISRKIANCSFGVKTVSGKVEMLEKDNNTPSNRHGFHKFLKRLDLLERRSVLAPSGTLTIVCCMRVIDSLDCTMRLIELSDNFESMLISQKDCNITLRMKGKEFPVHKSVLASRSTVFEAMFQADMKENTEVVDIDDCDPAAFKNFLLYIYCGKFEMSSCDLFELYKIARKYCVGRLKSACVHFILNNLSVDNVLDASVLGHNFDEPELKKKSEEFFIANFADVVPTQAWVSLLINNHTLANGLLIIMANGIKTKKKENETERKEMRHVHCMSQSF